MSDHMNEIYTCSSCGSEEGERSIPGSDYIYCDECWRKIHRHNLMIDSPRKLPNARPKRVQL